MLINRLPTSMRRGSINITLRRCLQPNHRAVVQRHTGKHDAHIQAESKRKESMHVVVEVTQPGRGLQHLDALEIVSFVFCIPGLQAIVPIPNCMLRKARSGCVTGGLDSCTCGRIPKALPPHYSARISMTVTVTIDGESRRWRQMLQRRAHQMRSPDRTVTVTLQLLRRQHESIMSSLRTRARADRETE